MWRHCKSASFSYGESLQTPPLERTSLHWWNYNVERPWGILSLFTTCLQIPQSLAWQRLWHRSILKIPLKELHSTDEIIMWRDPGGSWACLLPVYKYQWVCHGQSCDTDKWRHCKSGSFSYGESPQTPPLEGTSLHRWNNSVERPWGILSLFTTCLQIPVSLPWQKLWHRQVASL